MGPDARPTTPSSEAVFKRLINRGLCHLEDPRDVLYLLVKSNSITEIAMVESINLGTIFRDALWRLRRAATSGEYSMSQRLPTSNEDIILQLWKPQTSLTLKMKIVLNVNY